MGRLWTVFAVVAGAGILVCEALLVLMVLAYLAHPSLGRFRLVVVSVTSGLRHVKYE